MKRVFTAELDIGALLARVNLKKKFRALSVYPGISRDISIVLKEGILAKDILTLVRERGGACLKDAAIADYYTGKQIPDGCRGLTVSCLFRSDERTLTEDEVYPLYAGISKALTETFGAQLR